jgi:hypothetical protein
MWNRRLTSSTVVSGQTSASRSLLLTTSLGRAVSAINMSMARALSLTGAPLKQPFARNQRELAK